MELPGVLNFPLDLELLEDKNELSQLITSLFSLASDRVFKKHSMNQLLKKEDWRFLRYLLALEV